MSVDWKARAEREAAALVDGLPFSASAVSYQALVDVAAIAWMQGAIYATHADLADFEQGFERLRAAL